MAYEVLDTHSGSHRDTAYYDMVWFGNETHYYIDGIQVVVVRLKSDNLWWIIPNLARYEDEFEDLGPYESVEEAIVYLRLHSECREVTMV